MRNWKDEPRTISRNVEGHEEGSYQVAGVPQGFQERVPLQ